MKRKYRKKDFSYYLFQLLRYPAKWFMHSKLNLNLIKNEAKDDKGPFFITGNHVTAYDPIIALVYLKPMVRWIAADANWDSKIKTILMKLARVIPIAKRKKDVRPIKELLKEVKAGNPVGLYPEGGRNWDGETTDLIASTAKLIKLLGIKVYCQKLEGAYVSSPRWGKTLRKGRCDVTIYQMLSEEEVKQMTEKEIFEVLEKHLYHNDYDYQREQMVLLEGKDHAEYIERLIYVCPKCHEIHSFASIGDQFKCKACESKGTVNQYGFIEGDFPYDNLVEWSHFQKDYLFHYLKENEVKPIQVFDVKHKFINDSGEIVNELANIYINKDEITIESDKNHHVINYENLSEVSITFKNTLIFYDEKSRHELIIEPFLHQNASIVYIKTILNYLRGQNHGK